MGLSVELSLRNSSCWGASGLLVSHCSDKIPTEQREQEREGWLQLMVPGEQHSRAPCGSRHVRPLMHILADQEAGEGERKHLVTLSLFTQSGTSSP